MLYTIITSLNQKYWDETSKINIQSWAQFLPPEIKIVIYSEDEIDIGNLKDRITVKDIYSTCPKLLEFKNTHKHNPHYNGDAPVKETKKFKWNAIKFAHKTFPIFEESKVCDTNYLIWLDADVLMHDYITMEWLAELFPQKSCISYLGRPSNTKTAYDECGLMGYNLKTPLAKNFLVLYEAYYEGNNLDELRETHDSWIFYQLRLSFEAKGISGFKNLNPNPVNNKSPFNNSGINQYMVHCKGKGKEKLHNKFLKRFSIQSL